MKRQRSTLCLFLVVATCWAWSLHAQQVQVYFSPRGGCAAAICREINAAKTSILIQAYSISESQITAALSRAHNRGVRLSLVVSKTQQNDAYSTAPSLKAQGIPVVCDRVEALQHNKVIILDQAVTITGSYNFSRAAEQSNAENLVIIRDINIAAAFTADWQKHHDHSSAYKVIHHDDYKPPQITPGLIQPLKPRPRKRSL